MHVPITQSSETNGFEFEYECESENSSLCCRNHKGITNSKLKEIESTIKLIGQSVYLLTNIVSWSPCAHGVFDEWWMNVWVNERWINERMMHVGRRERENQYCNKAESSRCVCDNLSLLLLFLLLAGTLRSMGLRSCVFEPRGVVEIHSSFFIHCSFIIRSSFIHHSLVTHSSFIHQEI